MEQDINDNNDNDRITGNPIQTLSEAERVTFTIEGLRVLIEGVKALSVMRLLYQIQLTTDDQERVQLEHTLREMVVTVYR